MDKQFYYADANSQPAGPLTLNEIRRFADAEVKPQDVMVCQSDDCHWMSTILFKGKKF